MGWFSSLFGSDANISMYHKPHRDSRGLAPDCEMVSCLGCGAGNGTPCKCDPELGRKPKWWEC